MFSPQVIIAKVIIAKVTIKWLSARGRGVSVPWPVNWRSFLGPIRCAFQSGFGLLLLVLVFSGQSHAQFQSQTQTQPGSGVSLLVPVKASIASLPVQQQPASLQSPSLQSGTSPRAENLTSANPFDQVASSAQKTKTLIIGVSDWAPYNGYDLPGHGLLTEIVQVAMKRVGYRTVAQETPWSRVIKGAARGEIDLIPGIWFSDERAETILYGTVLATARLVLISREDNPNRIETMEDLKNLTVGVVQDYAYPDFFLKAKNFERDLSRNLDLNLIKLAKGRIDAALGDELVARHTSQKLFGDKVRFRYGTKPLYTKKVYLGISRANPEHDRILYLFEKALAEMKADGSYDDLLEKHNIHAIDNSS